MSAKPSQLVDPQEFIPLLDYHFLGNDVTITNKRKVIDSLRRRAVIYLAAQDAGVNKLTVYRWRDADPEFAAAMTEAMEDAKEIMENSIYERALAGDSLLTMFWTKRHDPAYRDKTTIDIQVVQSEISERMQALNLSQLPPMTPQFVESAIDTGYSQTAQDSQSTHVSRAIPAPASQSAKRDE
jgi:hypothetical protein